MLALLRDGFVNTWVLAKDLEAIAARDGGKDMAALCKSLRDNYGYPVDSVLVGSDLRVLGHVNAHDVFAEVASYETFLRTGLGSAGRPVPVLPAVAAAKAPASKAPNPLKPTPEQPTASLLDVVRQRGFGQISMAYHPIDVSAFADGGVLELEVRVGRAAMGAVFELCVAAELPGDGKTPGGRRVMEPVLTRSVASDGTDKLVHTFAKGDGIGLVVKPAAGCAEGDANAFFVSVTVRRPKEPKCP